MEWKLDSVMNRGIVSFIHHLRLCAESLMLVVIIQLNTVTLEVQCDWPYLEWKGLMNKLMLPSLVMILCGCT